MVSSSDEVHEKENAFCHGDSGQKREGNDVRQMKDGQNAGRDPDSESHERGYDHET